MGKNKPFSQGPEFDFCANFPKICEIFRRKGAQVG